MKNKSAVRKCEEKLLAEVGLTPGVDYRISDVLFPCMTEDIGHMHYIEVFCCRPPQEMYAEPPEKLVLVHGFGSAGIFFYRVIAQLRNYFHIFAVDQYGMGSSARPAFPVTFDGAVSYFVDALEAWRQKMKLTDFVLLGHSLGAYISSHWVRLKNPQLKMLYLLSPAGFTQKLKEEIVKDPGLLKTRLVLWIYNSLVGKVNLYQLAPKFMLESNFKSKRIGLPEKEAEAAATYLSLTLTNDNRAEQAVALLLEYGLYSHYPITRIIQEIRDNRGFQYPIKVIYGESDWMDFKHSIKINKDFGLKLSIEFVAGSSHQIMLQNPKGLASIILEDQKQGFLNLKAVDSFDPGFLESPGSSSSQQVGTRMA